jgi:hypothetical protein
MSTVMLPLHRVLSIRLSAQNKCTAMFSVICFREYASLAATRVLDLDINEFSPMQSVIDHCQVYNIHMNFCILCYNHL